MSNLHVSFERPVDFSQRISCDFTAVAFLFHCRSKESQVKRTKMHVQSETEDCVPVDFQGTSLWRS